MQDNEINDVTGIGWFNAECLHRMIHNHEILINYHCKLLLEFYLKFRIKINQL